MSRGSSVIRALLASVVTALAASQRTRRKRASEGASGGKRPTTPAKWRNPADSRSTQHAQAPDKYDDSPGQSGNGATRDLTSAELRAMRPSYSPKLDGEPDPGEVIWTWVPYVENDGRGKDRPVLIIARLDAESWAACYLSTKEHHGFVSVGTGHWDSQGRESYLSPERVLRITEAGMRRESTGIDKTHYDRAVQAVQAWHRLT